MGIALSSPKYQTKNAEDGNHAYQVSPKSPNKKVSLAFKISPKILASRPDKQKGKVSPVNVSMRSLSMDMSRLSGTSSKINKNIRKSSEGTIHRDDSLDIEPLNVGSGVEMQKELNMENEKFADLASALFQRKKQEKNLDMFITRFSSSIRSKYHVSQKEMGRGAYGVVRECKERETGNVFAVKSMFKAKIKNLSRLKKEIEIMASLSHPNIVTLHEVCEDEKFLHLITPLYTGGDLFQKIVAKGRFCEAEAAEIARQILDAVAYCHGVGVAHRDLKPENLMFESNLPNSPLKVIDFGLAKLNDSGSDHMKSFVGTPYFVDPEVMQKNFTTKCDLWSIGIILYILLCGYPPFMGDSDREIFESILYKDVEFMDEDWAHISAEAKDLILCLLQKKSEDRPTADVALSHPWFTTTTGAQISEFYSTSNFMQQRFQRHVMRTKLQKVAVNTIAHQLTEAEISHLKTFFEEMDENGNGFLSMKELQNFLERMENNSNANSESVQAFKAFFELDINANTVVDLDEFIAAAIDRNICIREENILAAFHYFDADQSGIISPQELSEFFGTQEHAQEAIQMYDLDGNGKLDFSEFKKMMMAM
mmetsp:Transcript_10799/g.14013  ORF Transcript_10799/g.14013 Transcript_10799/m.14013 type:complete len:594 (+) Transcript_10799:255-2036(+)